jgi:hypothetical protein
MKKQLLFIVALIAGGTLSAQVYLNENFDGAGTTLPSGWSVTTADATSDGWLRDATANLASTYWGYPDNGGKVMSTNDDNCDCNKSADRLIFPSTDLTAATAPFLVMDQFYFAQAFQTFTEVATLEVSTDAGANWTVLTEIAGNTVNGWQTVSFPLSAYAGMNNVVVSIKYNDDGGWMYGFGVDNVSIQEQPEGVNVAVTGFTAAPLIDAIPTLYTASSVVSGRDIYFVVDLNNTSGNTINSLDLTVTSGSQTVTQSFTGLNLAWLGNTTLVLDSPIPAASGNNNYSVVVSNINGGNDDDSSDNTADGSAISGVSLHPDKAVLVEEATGTWCGWCVRGTIMMDYMSNNYPDNFIGITVHNADPMVLTAYDTWIGGFIGGYPSILADRDGAEYDPLDMENVTVEKAVEAPAATLSVAHSLSGNQLTITTDAHYNQNLTGDYRIAVVLVEDHLSGTGTTWSQTNYYAGGPYGPMGGFENETSPVPGLFYDHVGRALLGGIDGDAGSLPASGTAGSTYQKVYTTTVDPTWNLGYVKPVAIMINNATGEVVNAKRSAQAVQVNETPSFDNSLIVYPNPSNGVINILANDAKGGKAVVKVFSSTGELVLNTQIQNISTNNVLDVSEFGSGLYTIVIDSEGYSATRRVTVTK